MDNIIQWGFEYVIAIQELHSPLIDSFFRFISYLGGIRFSLCLIIFILWCVDYELGIRLAIILGISGYTNFASKSLFKQPRPFNINANLKLIDVSGYGFPSGHAQSVILIWIVLSTYIKKTWFWILSFFIILTVSFSRFYLGAHFILDILGGWILGLIFIAIFLYIFPYLEIKLKHFPLRLKILLSFLITFLITILHLNTDISLTMGFLAGISIGVELKNKYFPFSIEGSWFLKILRFIVGIIFLFIIDQTIRIFYPVEKFINYQIFAFFHIGILGIFISFIISKLFTFLKLINNTKID